MALKLPFKLASRKAAATAPEPRPAAPAAGRAGALTGRNFRLFLTPALLVLLFIAGVLVFFNARDSKHAADRCREKSGRDQSDQDQ